jgi:hypothetical protein
MAKNDNKWALHVILRFLQTYIERVEHKEISGATLKNYVKSIKLFCEMNDINTMEKDNKRTAKG